jgi:hypothetical protein
MGHPHQGMNKQHPPMMGMPQHMQPNMQQKRPPIQHMVQKKHIPPQKGARRAREVQQVKIMLVQHRFK